MNRRVVAFLLFSFVWSIRAALAGDSAPSELTVERIYSSNDFNEASFSAQWLKDGVYVTLESAEGDAGGRDIVAWQAETGERTVLVKASQLVPEGKERPLTIDGYQFSDDQSHVLIFSNAQRVWRRRTRGDYWLLDRSTGSLRQLGGDAPTASLMFAKLSPAGDRIAYVRENNLYHESRNGEEIVSLTSDGSADVINGTFDWVHEEEFGLRDGFHWSPDGKSIAYWQLDTTNVPEFVMIDHLSGSYPQLRRFKYPKAGERNATSRIGVVTIADQQTRWIDIPGHSDDHYLPRMRWAYDSNDLLIQHMNRLQNTNDVLLADGVSGRVTKLFREQDEAWIDVHDEWFCLEDGRFTWISEREGWRHLYLVARSGEMQQVTSGDWDMIRLLHIDTQRDQIYFMASPDDPTRRYLFRSGLDGGQVQRLTPEDQPGVHSYELSPDGRWAIHRYSSFDTPPRVELIRLPEHRTERVLVDNQRLAERLAAVDPSPVEFFRVDIGDGIELDGYCLKPSDFDPQKKYPLLIYVYGEPAAQTVLDRWGGKGQLWHRMMAQRGYVVMSFDNRGTPAPRGRAWRKVVYRQVGVLAPTEQAAALTRVLEDRPYLDAQRVGIWGWSGGGSMALNAIFKHPELYHTAVAVAPVADQHLYDTIYQERYMGLPDDNIEGYSKGSSIHFAERLEGHLLLVHGTADDNVHYQITELLIDELIRHNKPFTMMAYPSRSHSISERENTTLHLRNLLTDYFTEHLPPGQRDASQGIESDRVRPQQAVDSPAVGSPQ